MPIGERIGDTLPARCSLVTVLVFAFLLGNLAAFGEPVIGSLQIAGSGIDPAAAPLLHTLLVGRPVFLSLTVSLGVGVAVVIGTLRFIYGWSLKPIVLSLVGLSAALTLVATRDQNLATAIGLAWDTGAVIVGPVLCPLVLSLGLGVCRATGRADPSTAGFGIVGLVSIVPVVAVTALAFTMSALGSPGGATSGAAHAAGVVSIGQLLGDSFWLGVRAIAPIFLFLYAFVRFYLDEETIPVPQFVLGLVFAVFGLLLFNFGLAVGLGELGNQVGERLPATFHPAETSIYPTEIGKVIVVLFGVVLGYGATLAEPAFNVLGQQVEDVTQGAFKKWLFSRAVAIGVGFGAGFGMLSIVYQINLLVLLLPPYLALVVLTLVNEEKYVKSGPQHPAARSLRPPATGEASRRCVMTESQQAFHLIACLIQRGKGDTIAKAAAAAGAGGATIFFARGTGHRERLGLLGLAIVPEKEVVLIVCEQDESRAIFDAVATAGKLDTPGMGIAFVIPIHEVAGLIPRVAAT